MFLLLLLPLLRSLERGVLRGRDVSMGFGERLHGAASKGGLFGGFVCGGLARNTCFPPPESPTSG